MERNQKWEIPHSVLERPTLCFNSCNNRKSKVKLWPFGTRKRKKRAFFVALIFSEDNLFNIYVLCQCIVYWIHFQNIHTFTNQKHYFLHFFHAFQHEKVPCFSTRFFFKPVLFFKNHRLLKFVTFYKRNWPSF